MTRRHPAAGRAAAVASLAALAAGCGRNPSALDPHGPGAEEAASLFWLMTALGAAVFALVVGLLVATALRRRSGSGGDGAGRRPTLWVIAGGVVLPVVVVVPLSVLTLFSLQRTERPAEEGALEIHVVGHQFWWHVSYPEAGAVTANEVHLPVGRDVRIVLTTADVIHSFWVPNLSGKRDMIPGEVTDLVLRAEQAGVYEGACAEFCGVQHAWMRLLVVAQPDDEFDAWLADQARPAAAPATAEQEAGLGAFLEVGCASCHAIRGTPASGDVGPDLTHLASRRRIGSGVVPNTAGHLAGWISNPHGIKPGTTMPPTPLTGEQLTDLLRYLENLR